MYSASLLSAQTTVQVLTSLADIFTFTPSFPVEIYEFGVIISTGLTASDNLILALDKRVTAGSDSGRGTADLGTLTIAAADSGGIAAGDVIVSRPSGGPYIVYPGQQAVLEVTNAVAAGGGIPFINYRLIPALDRSSGTITNPVTA